MQAFASKPVRFSSLRPSAAFVPAALFAALAAACGGSSSGSGQSGIPGEEGVKETGAPFIVDPNQSGGAANLHLAEVLWGRLVDVHQIDANGDRVDPPVFEDFVISPTVSTDFIRYVLDRNPVTQRERLVIQDIKDPPQPNGPPDRFFTLLREASEFLPFVADKNDDGTSSPPFTAVPRNACMVLRFDDCLDDSDPVDLLNNVKVLTGYPPTTPYSARVIFDPNYGAKVGGSFHTTRVLVDMTISQIEAADPQGPPLDVNAIGLPKSRSDSDSPNVSVRLPSNADLGSGQQNVLTNLDGSPLDLDDNGPLDFDTPTLDLVRAVRSGNSNDSSNGFLQDDEKPRVIGGWPIDVTSAADDLAGESGFDFTLNLTFTTTCRNAPAVGDVVVVGEIFAQVTEAAPLAGSDVSGLKVRTAFELDDPSDLESTGLFEAPFQTSLTLPAGCWVTFTPAAVTPPTTEVRTMAQILARFSEPMDPDSLSPFSGRRNDLADGFMVVNGAAGPLSTAIASNIVVGEVLPANRDLTSFTYTPTSPYPHDNGSSETLHVELGEGVTDLAGNRLRSKIPFVDFTIAPLEGDAHNGSIVLRFDSNDEYAPDGSDPDLFGDPPDGLRDLRGQFFYGDGKVTGRQVAFAGWPVDRNSPVPMRMFPFGGVGAVFAPMNPLGSRFQMLWRYCDTGWDVRDETKYNLDVIGLSWSPFNGAFSDFFDQFEILLGHSRFLPDEGPPVRTASGLPAMAFDDNYLAGSNPVPGARGGVVVHNRALGYQISPSDQFTATSGTAMMPYPLNRGQGAAVTYTWRDTSILTLGCDGDPAQAGIPLQVEFQAGLIGPMEPGSVARFRQVPSFGLPLLIEIRCHPSDQGLGFNAFSLANANGTTTIGTPNFRAYSGGGINTLGNPEVVLPDAEIAPRGTFNPGGVPPGARTRLAVDSVFFIGQLDTVVRVSRAHTVWLDAGTSVFPLWQLPVIQPPLTTLPTGAQLLIDYRATTGFSETGNEPFDALKLDSYGNQINAAGDPLPLNPTDWFGDITIGNNQRFIQVRLTFISNIDTGVGPELDVLALPYEIQ